MTDEDRTADPELLRYRKAMREALYALTCDGRWQGCTHREIAGSAAHDRLHAQEAAALLKRALRERQA